MTIERANLLNVFKLVIKELIDSSLSHGRMLDDDHWPLQQFFVVLEHVLRHGIKRRFPCYFSPKSSIKQSEYAMNFITFYWTFLIGELIGCLGVFQIMKIVSIFLSNFLSFLIYTPWL